jgi:hypothetical protein
MNVTCNHSVILLNPECLSIHFNFAVTVVGFDSFSHVKMASQQNQETYVPCQMDSQLHLRKRKVEASRSAFCNSQTLLSQLLMLFLHALTTTNLQTLLSQLLMLSSYMLSPPQADPKDNHQIHEQPYPNTNTRQTNPKPSNRTSQRGNPSTIWPHKQKGQSLTLEPYTSRLHTIRALHPTPTQHATFRLALRPRSQIGFRGRLTS